MIKLNDSKIQLKYGNSTVAGLIQGAGSGFAMLDGFTPIARWDAWNLDTVSAGDTHKPGVVAYSANGIKQVTFNVKNVSDLSTVIDSQTVFTEAYNSSSDQQEYFPSINTAGFADGVYVVEAIVEEKGGEILHMDQPAYPLDLYYHFNNAPGISIVSPLSSGKTRPGEVSHSFRVYTPPVQNGVNGGRTYVDGVPTIYVKSIQQWRADGGHGATDYPDTISPPETGGDGTLANPYLTESARGCIYKVFKLATNYFPIKTQTGGAYWVHLNEDYPVDIRMIGERFDVEDINPVNNWQYQVKDLKNLGMVTLKPHGNPGTTTFAAYLGDQYGTSNARLLWKLKDLNLDYSDTATWDQTTLWKTNNQGQIVFDNCTFTATQKINTKINGEDVEDWDEPIYFVNLTDRASVYYNNCSFNKLLRPNLSWNRGCRIQYGGHDFTRGPLTLSLTVVDASKRNTRRGFWEDIHADLYQEFSSLNQVGSTFIGPYTPPIENWNDAYEPTNAAWDETKIVQNVIMRDYNLIRYDGQGIFLSGFTPTWSRVAVVNCDLSFTNREPGETVPAFIPEDGTRYTASFSYTGAGFGRAIDQWDGYKKETMWEPSDGYETDAWFAAWDNNPPMWTVGLDTTGWTPEQIAAYNGIRRDYENMFSLSASGYSSGDDYVCIGQAKNCYFVNSTLTTATTFKQRSFSGDFDPVVQVFTNVVIEDCFDENGEFWIPGSNTPKSYDDRNAFIMLYENDPESARFSGLVASPALTQPYSTWQAAITPRSDGEFKWLSTRQGSNDGTPHPYEYPIGSYYTTNAIYRTTTGISAGQYPL